MFAFELHVSSNVDKHVFIENVRLRGFNNIRVFILQLGAS